MENIEQVVKEIQDLIRSVVYTENEGYRRCLNSDDLNNFERWCKILNEGKV